MTQIKWLDDNKIQIVPPSKPKKITATRFASILGLNPWSSPFEVWCAVTRTWEKPFEETKYTAAGKVIEGLQIDYMKKAYFMTNLRTPTDLYGENFFSKTRGDFFPEHSIVGGMFDSILVGDNEEVTGVLEFKTTKRSEDWQDDIPEYYALQAALYAYLLGVDSVIMVASFLEEKDYTHPEDFVPSAKNTIVVPFKLSERYPNFDKYVKKAEKWWKDHVVKGISPVYDEKRDADILKELRTNNLNPDTDIEVLIKEAEEIKMELELSDRERKPRADRLKVIQEIIKQHAMEQFRDGDDRVHLQGMYYEWSVSKSESVDVDKEALKKDGLLDKYSKPKTTFRLTTKTKEELTQ